MQCTRRISGIIFISYRETHSRQIGKQIIQKSLGVAKPRVLNSIAKIASEKNSLKIPNGTIRIRKSKKDRKRNGHKKKGQKDKQRYTKLTHTTKDQVIRTPLKTKGILPPF